MTGETSACFEPALDYLVVKIPRWDLKKFKMVEREIGSQMKSVGEVMAVGRKFEECLQKAIRMLDVGAHGLVCNDLKPNVEEELTHPSDERIFALVEAMKKGYSCEELSRQTGVNQWFLRKIENVIDLEKLLSKTGFEKVDTKLLLEAKQMGFSDKQLSTIFGNTDEQVKTKRDMLGVKPFVKQIDTLAAEFPARTNYLYLTYNGNSDDVSFSNENKVAVVGSGVYRIGSSVEFDWCCVSAVETLKNLGRTVIMINYNPETVSTDYNVCDKLYFEEISFETVREIYEKENPQGILVSMGGQISNNIAVKLEKAGLKIIGTQTKNIDNAEDRSKFSKMLDLIGVNQPEWKTMTSIEESKKFAEKVGYPVLVRPSYVLSGAAMNTAFNHNDLETYLGRASKVNEEHPVVLTKFMINSKELEVDAVAVKGQVVVQALSEHVENAGVHSGDATMIYPAQTVSEETSKKVSEITKAIASKLEITGPFNIQFLARDDNVLVIECNLRASRSFPFVSKVSGFNFIQAAVKLMMGEQVNTNLKSVKHVGVKAPQFSFSRVSGADPLLSVEMSSTGEVGCLGKDVNDAFLKALIASGFKIPKKNVLVSLGGLENKEKLLNPVKDLTSKGYNIFATPNTSKFLESNGVNNTLLHKISDGKTPNVKDWLNGSKLDLIINVPKNYAHEQKNRRVLHKKESIRLRHPLNNKQAASSPFR